jgi:hypothetical protein
MTAVHDAEQPPDWALILWHPDPSGRTYRSWAAALRACRWLNANHHDWEAYEFRPAIAPVPRRVILERRWNGALPPI